MKPYYTAPGVDLYLGEFREVMASIEQLSVDAVLTDPPYPREYLPMWGDLGRSSGRLLKRGGSLLAIAPHYAIPEIISAVNVWLKYRWLVAMKQESGAHPRMAMGIEVTWKPVIWWVKGAWPVGRGFMRDSFENTPPDKAQHKWAQSRTWAEAMLRFVPADGVVCDPLMGAGTMVLAARAARHPVIGIDNDERCCEITAKALDEMIPCI